MQYFSTTARLPRVHNLSVELQDALRVSRSLVVICSPFAVASEHVQREIAYFQSIGRAESILCLIASGVPNATDQRRPELECFPAALRCVVGPDGALTDQPIAIEERPLAAALGDESREQKAQALEQIAAGLLDLSQDRLRNLRTRRVLSAAAMTLGLVAATAVVGGGYWYAYHEPVVSYYKDYVRRWGTWEGVDPVSPQIADRATAYEFTSEGAYGRPTRVRLLQIAELVLPAVSPAFLGTHSKPNAPVFVLARCSLTMETMAN